MSPAEGLPSWWEPLLTRVATARTEDFTSIPPPADGGRASAVLVLLGEDRPGEPDLLVLQRAATMRNHAGQPAFPGGAADPEDRDPSATALREAQEEVGLDPASATVLTTLPELYIPVSRFVVTPVLAWWHTPHPVGPRQPAEVDRVARLPVADLVDPDNRLRVRHPSGWTGPAFDVQDMLVWGFTASVIATLLDLAGWSRPWRPDRIMELPDAPGVTRRFPTATGATAAPTATDEVVS
ncbi:CoA pyrophosphatase [Actinoplanes sp. N902-109]|uniref:NUDIX hydrolase n=1 Tax=Actinoplanes sp. (strain N902-109) TaxID=649831 RepID=UPI000329340F|nr:CoA pyrophosphatase [Actinoplanes sp. N902-109]AGL21409.1 NUDIX hydrolase [Actinoplanes sp. N902-109]